jgi:hypothetical protein
MGAYALVIGIDGYKNTEWNLNSAVDDALAFADWAITKGGVNARDLTLLLSPHAPISPQVTLRSGAKVSFGAADSGSIVRAVNDLAQRGGDRVFVYFAGHGCSAPGSGRDEFPEPVLIPSDAADLATDYKLLLGYSELQHPLLESGPDEQFFFFDACRDFRLEGHERGVGSAVGPRRGEGGRRPQYLLCAASPGERANELGKGIFGGVLLDALSGYAAVSFNPRSGQFDLTFQGLSRFVVEEVSNRINRAFPIGSAEFVQKPQPLLPKEKPDTIVASYDPAQVPQFPITIRVGPSSALKHSGIEVYYYTPAGEFLVRTASVGPPLYFPAQTQLRPGDYSLRVAPPKTFNPGRLSITVPKELEFDIELVQAPLTVTPESGAAPAGLPKALIFQSLDRNIPLIVERPDTDALVVGVSEVRIDNPPIGIYRVRLVLPEGQTPIRLVDFPRDGDRFEIVPPLPKVSAPQLEAVAAVGMKPAGEAYVQPSELIGPVADTNLASLLSLAAYATYSFKDPAYMGKLRNLGLRQIPGVQSAAGWMSVLLGATGSHPVGLSPVEFLSGSVVAVTDYMETIDGRGVPSPIPNLPAAAEFGCECPAGPKCIELRLPGFSDTRYATVVLANHVTVLVIVANDDSTVDVQQYVLPLSVESGDPQPADMRIIELAQRFYASSDRVPDYVIDRLLEAKFVDPILGCLAGYLLVRQGQADRYRGDPRPSPGDPRLTLSPMLNMLRLFDGIPDSHVVAGLADPDRRTEHFANAATRGIPLFMEGFSALFSRKDSNLDPFLQSFRHSLLVGSPWTAWTAREPVLDLANGHVQTPPKSWTVLENARTQIETLAASVGAVRKVDGGGSATIGTAFVIDESRAITSKRVADEIAEETSGQWRLKSNLAAFVNFGENPATTARQFRISEIRLVPEAHLSIITVEEPFQTTPLTLADTATSTNVLDNVYLVGYPVSDSRGDPAVAAKAVRSAAGVKRVLPGIILEMGLDGKSFDHSCFTLTGSGGSPVVQLSTGRVVGVHWGGWKRSYGRGRAAVIHAHNDWL